MSDLNRRDLITGACAISLAGILPERSEAAVIPPPPFSAARSLTGRATGLPVACFTRGENLGSGTNGGTSVTGGTYTVQAGTLIASGGTTLTNDTVLTSAVGCDGRFALRNYAGMADVAGFKIAFANWSLANIAYAPVAQYEVPGSNAVTLTASLEFPFIYASNATTLANGFATNSNIIQALTFNGGATSVVIQPGETVWTDWCGQYLHASSSNGPMVRWHIQVPTGGSWPRGFLPASSLSENAAEETTAVDETQVGTFYVGSSTTGSTSGYQFGPLAVVGIPTRAQPSVLIVGDSLSWGQGDDAYGVAGNGNYSGTPTGDGYGAKGPIERALCGVSTGPTLTGAGFGRIKIAKSGITAQQLSSYGTFANGTNLALSPQLRWRELAQYCTNAIVLLGTNDLSAANGVAGAISTLGTTTAVAGAQRIFYLYLAEIYQALAAAGCRVFACTVPPNTVTQNPNGSVTGTIYGQPAPGYLDGSQVWPYGSVKLASTAASGSNSLTLTNGSTFFTNAGLVLAQNSVYPIQGIAQGTVITSVTGSIATLSQPLTGSLASGQTIYLGDSGAGGTASIACSIWNPNHPNGRNVLNKLIANAPNDPALKGSVYGVIDVGRAAGIDDGTGKWVYSSSSSTLNASIDGTHWQWGAGAASNGIPVAQAVFARAMASGAFVS